MKINQIIMEAELPKVGIIFGRFNPPHKGHKAAWEMMKNECDNWYVSTNTNTRGPKDPLPYEIKTRAMEAIMPEIREHIMPETNWFTLASAVFAKHGKVELRVYSDEQWVLDGIVKYNGQDSKNGYYNFPTITPVKTPRLSSATALRQAVADDDESAFYNAAGVPQDTKIGNETFFEVVKKYLDEYKK
jgi:cytidyltransferase-like protein